MRDAAERFFFVHVQKTAGTAFDLRVRRHFTDRQVYPNAGDGDALKDAPQMSPDHLVRQWQVRGDEIRLVTGHFPLCTTELLGGGFTTLTLLRNPVDRTLSYLRHFRVLTPSARKKPLEEIYEDPDRFRWLVHNHMVKMFALRRSEMTKGMLTEVDFTPAHLERAKERLATVDVVGLQERFEEFCAEVQERFGWDLGDPIFANRTKPEPVSDELLERIATDNALDVEFYEYAVQLADSRRRPRA